MSNEATRAPRVSINLVTFNVKPFLGPCLTAVKAQTYPNLEIQIWDNGSTDGSQNFIKNNFPEFKITQLDKNYGMWPAQEKAWDYSSGEYIMVLSTDVILDPQAIARAVEIFQDDNRIGAIEPKLYQFEFNHDRIRKTQRIDTCGFEIFKNRRIVNIGHGQNDQPEFQVKKEIFAVEGAAPIFRKKTLEDCRLEDGIVDKNMFWYGDDLDLGWRINLFGWKQIFAPGVIGWHHRSTTTSIRKNWRDYLRRVKQRQQIPIRKRRLDWRNIRLALIKNDHFKNVFRHLPKILYREIAVLGYALIFEPQVLLEIPKLVRLIPRALRSRRQIMKKARRSADDILIWFK
ncbi:MAG: hypothetical protein COV31_01360 [Candidatus Yanofskybacteria bacterium CG10_big_fil_rev_8_21_14_0_10_46_23]|uniref:Glycosyltransferase 2-like domain-containing protein n=1 Tax=Candidatus Yanofskybacteria bacterium CG10_big_fil_rev_8_21_14_0_10_46_23 TaxID=1975098 RepID=A0A2H0R4P7_9BACT|nr:MAG: hypothetical protein COV31_01360 [Candidatus Yanofskybacteria bacterium CG10_big_fil_rev_8_21_14_0_10_46_23]